MELFINEILPVLSLVFILMPPYIEWLYGISDDSYKGHVNGKTTILGKVIKSICGIMLVLGVLGIIAFFYLTL